MNINFYSDEEDIEEVNLPSVEEEVDEDSFWSDLIKQESFLSLSNEQKSIIEAVIRRKESLFLTGPAGTGKSHTLKFIIKVLIDLFTRLNCKSALLVTASTGVAAWNIKGCTLHSGLALPISILERDRVLVLSDVMKRMNESPRLADKIRSTKVLIIDEISMVHGKVFDCVDFILQNVIPNGRGKPFGGVQVIICGDPLQFPPVTKKDTIKARDYGVDISSSSKKRSKKRSYAAAFKSKEDEYDFFFQSDIWKSGFFHTHILTVKFRQQGDLIYQDALNAIRFGIIKEEHAQLLRSRVGIQVPDDGIVPTFLFSTNNEANALNERRFRDLTDTEEFVYEAEILIKGNRGKQNKFLKAHEFIENSLIKHKIVLKKDVQVMLIVNYDSRKGLVNGSQGKVIGFTRPEIIYEDDNEGGTVNGKKTYQTKFSKKKKTPKLDEEEEEVAETLQTMPKIKKIAYPIVEFINDKGEKFTEIIKRNLWDNLNDGTKSFGVFQIPLIYSWAITVHKSQGLTLGRAKIDLKRTAVEDGAGAYVALSRLRDLNSLYLADFHPSFIKANEVAIKFIYKQYKKYNVPMDEYLLEAIETMRREKASYKDGSYQAETPENSKPQSMEIDTEAWEKAVEEPYDPEITAYKNSFCGFGRI